ncbi:biliverdin-producing heme oxygenase [Rothia nasimurium]|uniref:biliverdin-producing heme oxygenase n=1 Tax=Rothia nasimurium TaxID=85336 RepID=UPI002DD688B5|nr:biliverdin-producing heme oxygenase [Rothia nasimurium]
MVALVTRHYGVPAEALSMYRFEVLPKPKVFKDSYRGLLDSAPLTDVQRDALVDEALAGFDCNTRMFAQLGESLAS